ncbi:hypothetical protein J1N10_15955 [Carboxylicivirga sp. A043]|uniref:hypothetical protein n=1 Tax=Carboxylicivirga litoralis TaxID=2816963 RepID=UPI0021CB182D|nr:hypothetical protein [Carboxylicivirga sp. A043]MCU4157472.1 hypothetical protein [Carboxylicivirga sp. A043]
MTDKRKHTEDIDDQIIKDLFNGYSVEQAPDSLKSNTMDKVFKDWTAQKVEYKPLINNSNRWWILGSFAALLAISFLVDATVIIDYWNELKPDTTFINMDSFNKQLGDMALALKNLPSIVYFTVIGLFALLGIDRFFNRLANI